jgi:hypothetical protein
MAIRVLYAGNEASLRRLLKKELSLEGFDMLTAADSHQAQSILAQDDSVDVLLADTNLRPLDGIELAGRSARPREDLGVVVVGVDPHDMRRRAFAAGVDACLPKPYALSEVVALLKKVAGRYRR